MEVANALYSVPHQLIGHRVKARTDSSLFKVFLSFGSSQTHHSTRDPLYKACATMIPGIGLKVRCHASNTYSVARPTQFWRHEE